MEVVFIVLKQIKASPAQEIQFEIKGRECYPRSRIDVD